MHQFHRVRPRRAVVSRGVQRDRVGPGVVRRGRRDRAGRSGCRGAACRGRASCPAGPEERSFWSESALMPAVKRVDDPAEDEPEDRHHRDRLGQTNNHPRPASCSVTSTSTSLRPSASACRQPLSAAGRRFPKGAHTRRSGDDQRPQRLGAVRPAHFCAGDDPRVLIEPVLDVRIGCVGVAHGSARRSIPSHAPKAVL